MLKKNICKPIACLLVLLMLLAMIPLSASAAGNIVNTSGKLDNGISYDILGIGEVAISSYDGNESYVIIPDTIGGYPVTTIDYAAFEDSLNMYYIQIPDTVTTIHGFAFEGCEKLASIRMSKNLSYLGAYAFDNTAFYNDAANWENGVLYCGDVLVASQIDKVTGHYKVADGTYCIADNAFFYCTELTEVTIPSSVKKIPAQCFDNCSKLSKINLHSGITGVGQYAFNETAYYDNPSNWTNGVLYLDNYLIDAETNLIGQVDVKKGTTVIAESAFYECGAVLNIVLPDTVHYIGKMAFMNCKGIGEMKIPYGVTILDEYTFSGCYNLKSVYIPVTVTKLIDPFLLDIDVDLSDVYYGGSKAQWDSIKKDYMAEVTLENTTIHYNSYDGGVVKKTPISDCTITLSSTTYTYDGTAKKPSVTVKDGSKTLTSGTDYTVSYSNNVNAGTATVTVTGKGNYTGTATKNFTIKAPVVVTKPISDCTITLSQTTYTYDGNAKKPNVTVKDGTKVLTNGTDYTVSYSNNVNAGTATVKVTGKGNYTGSKSVTFTIIKPATSGFEWGKDNWNFENSYTYFGRTTYRKQINSTYANALKNNLTNSEYYAVFSKSGAWLDDTWGGSCYGMTSLALLSKEGYLNYSDYRTGAKNLYSMYKPQEDSDTWSLITYYQMLQVKDVIQQQLRSVPKRSHETNIKEIISLLDSNSTVMVGFKKAGFGGHEILAYGYEYGSWTFNGVSYDGCIKICDPNASMAYDSKANIYFNTRTYNWTIPLYSYAPVTSTSGAVFNHILADAEIANTGGYLGGARTNKINNFIARIDAETISDNRSVSKVMESNGGYTNQNSAPGDIVEDYSFISQGSSEGMIGYNLYDADAAYKISQAEATELSLAMDYEDCNMYATSKAGTSVVFDNNGKVSISGESADFGLSLIFDSGHPTDWFALEVIGEAASEASLQKFGCGYVLTGDKLKNIEVAASNREVSATTSFSTDYDSVFIYEIDVNTIGVRVDKDSNGTYETNLFTNEAERVFGDTNNDSSVNIKDATAIQKHVAELVIFDSDSLSVADFDGDNKITVKDATAIQKFIAGIKF